MRGGYDLLALCWKNMNSGRTFRHVERTVGEPPVLCWKWRGRDPSPHSWKRLGRGCERWTGDEEGGWKGSPTSWHQMGMNERHRKVSHLLVTIKGKIIEIKRNSMPSPPLAWLSLISHTDWEIDTNAMRWFPPSHRVETLGDVSLFQSTRWGKPPHHVETGSSTLDGGIPTFRWGADVELYTTHWKKIEQQM
jgi:hypothetical protein